MHYKRKEAVTHLVLEQIFMPSIPLVTSHISATHTTATLCNVISFNTQLTSIAHTGCRIDKHDMFVHDHNVSITDTEMSC